MEGLTELETFQSGKIIRKLKTGLFTCVQARGLFEVQPSYSLILPLGNL